MTQDPELPVSKGLGASALLALGVLTVAVPPTLAPGVTEAASVAFLLAAAVQPRGVQPLLLAPLALAALAGFSTAWSVDPGQSVFTTLSWLGGAAVVLAIRREAQNTVRAVLALVLVLMAIQAIRQASSTLEAAREAAASTSEATQSFVALWAARRRVFGPFASPDILAAFVVPVLPWTLALAQERASPAAVRTLGLAGVVAGGGCLLASQSVGAAGAAAVGLLVAVLAAWGRAHPTRVLAVLGGVTAALAFAVWWRSRDAATHVVLSGTDRLEDWANALQVWRQAPPWGVGAGAYESAFNRFSPPGRRYSAFVHSGPLQVLVELGPVGLVAILACYAALAAAAVKHARAGGLHIAEAAGVLAAVVHQCIDYDLHSPGGVGLWVGAGMLLAPRTRDSANWPTLRVGLGMASVGAAWLCAGVALCERGVPRIAGEMPDLVSDARGLALIPFDARAHLGVAEDLWMHAAGQASQGEDTNAAMAALERHCEAAAALAPLLPAGPMVLARSRLARGDHQGALEAYLRATERSCCSRPLRQELQGLAESLGNERVARAQREWLQRAQP